MQQASDLFGVKVLDHIIIGGHWFTSLAKRLLLLGGRPSTAWASILYKNWFAIAVIQAILRYANPNTTASYIRSIGLKETRDALEEGLKGPAQVIEFRQANAVLKKCPQRSHL